MKSRVVLLSGGVDSSTLLFWAKRRFGAAGLCALSFDYGQKHSVEIEMAASQARSAGVGEHKIVSMRFLKDLLAGSSALTDAGIEVPDLRELGKRARGQPPTYVPNRNMVLLSIAAAWAEARGGEEVYYGAHVRDRYGYWDCTPGFVRALNRAFSLNRRRAIRVVAPFAGMTKARIVRLGAGLGVDFSRTWSCYRGGKRPCGRCPTCVERAAAFRRCGIEDPLATADRKCPRPHPEEDASGRIVRKRGLFRFGS